ncbi:Gfo/Idh/MocA family protein [Paenibacillus nasutitermitis]|uniref:Dehydrogenase n=1 Tax=Paenibacillus nasutitermitis TaxID=1652958 RepID=A0A916Z2H2_9BACL|nr:Gfo/Idh/MocA family oxidoreductase [Paenibacillus nasutitermitis]GGD72921.1 dehydrogenase [Paenibacillus nasutitermitis]
MTNERSLRVAVAGCGTMGKLYASVLTRMVDIELAGFYARRSESAIDAAASFGTRLFMSYEELLAEADIDVVCITLPTYLHRQYAVQAAERGKHVICEKPMALTLEDTEAMMRASERYGTRLLVGHVLRFAPEYRNLRDHVLSGKIGKVGVGHARRASLHPPSGSWFKNEEMSGGVLFDLMIHDIDFMRWTLGEVRSVYASLTTASGIEYANATLRFASGAIVNLEAHWGYPGPFLAEVELAGQSGVMRCSNQNGQSLIVRQMESPGIAGEGVHIPSFLLKKDPYEAEIEHFIACIRTGAEPVVSAEDASRAVEIALAAGCSAQTGLPQKL